MTQNYLDLSLSPQLINIVFTKYSYNKQYNRALALFFAAGIERVSAVILQIALSLIIYKGIKSGKKSIVALAYGIHFLVDFVAVACAPRLSIWVIEALIVVMAVASFMLAHKLNKDSANSAE